jgi:hypothetical protein
VVEVLVVVDLVLLVETPVVLGLIGGLIVV